MPDSLSRVGKVPQNASLSPSAFYQLAEVPPETEWFADIQNPNTRAAYQHDVTQFMGFIGISGSGQLRQVCRAHVLAWRKDLERRKLSAASIRRKLAAVSSLFGFLCERNAVTNNPADGVSRPKTGANEGKTPALSDVQARALLAAPGSDTWQARRDASMLAVLLYHGLRASELCTLRIEDYAERRGLRTLSIQGKGGKIRFIPVHPRAVATVATYLDSCEHAHQPKAPLFVSSRKGAADAPLRPMARQRVRELIARYASPAGLPANLIRPHALRATAATNALERGADIARVQDWLGHANPATTRLYDKRGDKPEESPTFAIRY